MSEMKATNYLVFLQDEQNREKLVATTPSLEMARSSAAWMANSNNPKRKIVAALLCVQEEGGEVREMARYERGQKAPEILSRF